MRRHEASARRTWVIWVAVLVLAIAVPFGSFDPFGLLGPQVVSSQWNRGGPHPLDRFSSQLRWNPGS